MEESQKERTLGEKAKGRWTDERQARRKEEFLLLGWEVGFLLLPGLRWTD